MWPLNSSKKKSTRISEMGKLFTDFSPVTVSEWKSQLEKDLKGLPYEELIWHNREGFDIKPYYTSEDLTKQYHPAFEHRDWSIATNSPEGDATAANAAILKSLAGGAGSIVVHQAGRDAAVLLKDVRLDFIRSVFIGTSAELKTLGEYVAASYRENYPAMTLVPSHVGSAEDMKSHLQATTAFDHTSTNIICCDVLSYHNRYCHASYEIALAFAQGLEYLNVLDAFHGPALAIRTGVNADYFMQIAKLRAMRRLWEVLRKDLQVSAELHIVVETSLTNKTISDKYNNLLRTTVEAMAAVAGGCNELLVHDFEILSGAHSDMSRRLAVNQQLILKDESYLDKMADVGCGSYFIESLTDQLSAMALGHLKTIESAGGFFAALANGTVENEVALQAQQHLAAFEEGKEVSIGVSKFHNDKERIQMSAAELARLSALPIINPALRYELSHYLEKNHA